MIDRDPQLVLWLDELLATPGLTAIRDRERAWRELVLDSLTVLPLLAAHPGTIADIGAGGGVPGIPLAAANPDRAVVLIESSRRKCDFLARAAGRFANVRVVCGRAEEQESDVFDVVVARALAPPPVALEWCLPLVKPGGVAMLYVGRLEQDLAPVAEALAGGGVELHPVAGSEARQLVLVRKLAPTPAGFPRRPGLARKRPLV
ncbi:MAG: 16S rRNA (guanine(527)-N(7))-methyltransferase RsmG [Gaiellaceae bacterium]